MKWLEERKDDFERVKGGEIIRVGNRNKIKKGKMKCKM